MSTENLIDIQNVHKRYGRKRVLRGVDLAVPSGRVTALLGVNGAGKTTLMRVVSGLTKPDRGTVALGGASAARAGHELRRYIGLVSHAPLIDASEPGRYRKPLAATREYLDGLDAADQPVPVQNRVLAALGPKMLALAAGRSRGAHPYLTTPEHTASARAELGAGPLLLPEQGVVLSTDPAEARTIAADFLRGYLALPNYANNLLRSGFTEEDISSISDRLIDAIIAWGDEDAILRRIDEHRAAGADHVCVQVLTGDPREFPKEQWRRIAAALH